MRRVQIDRSFARHEIVKKVFRELVSSNPCGVEQVSAYAHVIHGIPGVGKTTLARSVASLQHCKQIFHDGIIWVDIEVSGQLKLNQQILLYNKILQQLVHTSSSTLATHNSFDEIVYVPSDQIHEKNESMHSAMLKAKDMMSKIIAHRRCLIVVDGLSCSQDIQFFQLTMNAPSEPKFRLMVTTADSVEDIQETLVWELDSLNDDEASKLFEATLKSCSNYRQLLLHVGTAHRECHGIPMSLQALGRMISYQHKRRKKKASGDIIMDCVRTLARGEKETYYQISTVLKHSLAQISIISKDGDDVAKTCLASFAIIFTRKDDCMRPLVARKVVLLLFAEIIAKLHLKSSKPTTKAELLAIKALESLSEIGILSTVPRDQGIFYQVSSTTHQIFGEELVKYAKTRSQLHEIFVTNYVSKLKTSKKLFVRDDINEYMVKWLPFHLSEARSYQCITSLLQEPAFIAARIHFLGIEDSAKKHISDAETLYHFLTLDEIVENHPQILLASYMAFSRELESKKRAEKINTDIVRAKCKAMQWFSYSLFVAGRIGEGFYMLNKSKPCDKKSCELFLEMETSNMRHYQNIHQYDRVGSARAQIRIGSIFIGLERGQESINLLEKGLMNLRLALGDRALEVARAQIYIGEIYCKMGLYTSAIEKFKPSLSVLMNDLGENSEELLDALYCVGQAFFANGDVDIALSVLEGILTKLDATSVIAKNVLITLARIFMLKKDHVSATIALNEAKVGYCSAQQLESIELLMEENEILRVDGRDDTDAYLGEENQPTVHFCDVTKYDQVDLSAPLALRSRFQSHSSQSFDSISTRFSNGKKVIII